MVCKLFLLNLMLSLCCISVFSQIDIENRSAQCCEDGTSLKDFLSKKTKYPINAQNNNLQGQVIIEFTIDKDGVLRDFTSVKQFDKECLNYTIEVLKDSPKWLPEIKEGRPIESRSSITFYFKLRGADTEIDVEPGDDDIIIWGYGTTKIKTIT